MANCAAWLSFTKAQAQAEALAAAEAFIPAAFLLAAWLPSKPLKSIVLSPRPFVDRQMQQIRFTCVCHVL